MTRGHSQCFLSFSWPWFLLLPGSVIYHCSDWQQSPGNGFGSSAQPLWVDAHPTAGLRSAALGWNIWAGSAAFLQALLRELHFGNAQQLHSSLPMKTHQFVDMKHKMPSGRWCYSGSVHRDSFSLHLNWCSRCREIISEQFFNTSKALFNIFFKSDF